MRSIAVIILIVCSNCGKSKFNPHIEHVYRTDTTSIRVPEYWCQTCKGLHVEFDGIEQSVRINRHSIEGKKDWQFFFDNRHKKWEVVLRLEKRDMGFSEYWDIQSYKPL